MEIGLVLPHSGPHASPSFIRDFAQTAEGCGIDRLWAVDHLVLPRHTDSPYVLGRKPTPVADGWLSENLAPNFELITTLSWVAGFTNSVGLGSSISVLPLRNPIVNAKQLASLDAFSGGRLVYGVGVGWLKEEATAMGMPWDRRGARSEEHIAVLRTLWCAADPYVEFHGRFYDFAPMDPRPQPAQRPIPILVGGHSDTALDRAVRIGDGWISAPTSAGRLAELIATLNRFADAQGRSAASLYKVASTAYSDARSLSETCVAYRRLGIDHVQVLVPGDEPRLVIDRLQEVATATRE
ncbi:TIGR03619 family F420-dependent LLM class oxidoreductase [Mycobacterium sp. HNNTM2301]|uniref:TIGR03619 family F420-dependent LLM class oxidoreductase n=1 Tax=Mycobacterium hainanense TaxID=3289775 RepID=UPI0035A71019